MIERLAIISVTCFISLSSNLIALQGIIISHAKNSDSLENLKQLFSIQDIVNYESFNTDFDATIKKIECFDFVVLSGSSQINAMNPDLDKEKQFLRETRMPIFGICLGHQIIADTFNAFAKPVVKKFKDMEEWDNSLLRNSSIPINIGHKLLDGRYLRYCHGYYVEHSPSNNFEILQMHVDENTGEHYVLIMRHKARKIFSVQGHPEYIDKLTYDDTIGRDFINCVLYNYFFPMPLQR